MNIKQQNFAGVLKLLIDKASTGNATDVDFIMRFEYLNDDYKLVCKRLEIPYSPLPRRNVSIRAHYSKYYDDELMEIVSNKFAECIEFGNYSFEMPGT